MNGPERHPRPVAAGDDDLFGQVDDLLHCYAEALDVAAAQRQVVWVPYGDGALARIKVPRLRAFTGYFAAVHIARSLTAARILLVRRAVGAPEDKPACLDRLALVDALEKALPRRPRLPVHATVAALVLGVAYLGGRVLSQSKSDVEPLRKLTGAVFRLDWGDMWNAISANSWHSLLFTALGLSIAAWLLIAGPMTSFHLKRLIFDLVPGADEKLRRATMSQHRVTRDGIYLRERETFAPLRRRRPRELRFDLVLEGLLVALGTGLFVYLAKTGVKTPKHITRASVTNAFAHPHKSELRVAGFCLLVALSALRLGALAYTARLQTAARHGVHRGAPAVEIVPAGWGRRAIAACVDAVLIAALWFGILFLLAEFDPYPSTAMILAMMLAIAPVATYVIYCAFALLLGRRRVGAQTVGKKIVGLSVVDRNGETPKLWHLVFRELVAKAVIFGWLGGGYLGLSFLVDILWPTRGGDRAALHDKIARTRVVRTIPALQTAIDAVPAMTPS